jgi:hypothetical protein
MPFAVSFLADPQLCLVRGHGPVDLAMWEEAMQQLVADPQFTQGLPILLDVSAATSSATTGEAAVAAIRWRALAPRSRGAIVTAHELDFDAAQQVERITDRRVRAFRDRDAAIAWLTL